MMENYLNILEESLQKKLKVLEEIALYNQGQEELLKKEKVSLEELDENMNQKEELIQKVTALDEGFETLYERIKEQILTHKDDYKEQIRKLQQLISQVTEKSVSIQAQEARNKKLIEDYFKKERSQLRQNRQSSKAAYDYYKSVNNANVVMPQMMDQKK
ncbi:MAG: flagellar protein FliT [Lachnospiraceae bacterium]|nr:flagellar protein FliT [Lachnospiraceae bacterium]MDD7628353.1 flagellar protein FliT [Lachnospiraceae bacterium]MDY4119403.1 flagellar protein FliT [Lachnospiraceae bacterium]